MNAPTLAQLIDETKGRFFTLKFLKADGSIRVINSKDKYFRLLHGGKSTLDQAGYTSLVNRNKESWFSVKPERVLSFKCGSVQQTF